MRAAQLDPLLWADAVALYQAPSGSRDELLGAAIIYHLGTEPLQARALRASGACKGDARAVGELLLWTLREAGVNGGALVALAGAVLRPVAAPPPAPIAAPEGDGIPILRRVDGDGNVVAEGVAPEGG